MKTYLLNAISKIRYLALLMFLTLITTNAWGLTATYTITSKTAVSQTGTAPANSSASYSQTYTNTAGQATKNNSMTLTLSGYDGCTITGVSVSVHNNKSSGAGSAALTINGESKGTISSISGLGTTWTDKAFTVTSTQVATKGTIVVTISCSTNSVFCQSFTITYTAASSCSNKVTISKGTESHGTFTLDKTGEQDACSALSVTVTPSPADHYHVASVSATNPATTGTAGTAVDNGDGTWTITYSVNAKGASTVNVTFEADPQYTVKWYVNGSVAHSQTGYEGATLTSIPTPTSSDCDGSKVFVGWYTDTYSHASTAPAFVSPTTIPNGGANYYAVFATASAGGNTNGSKKLVSSTSSTYYTSGDITGVSGTNSASWTDDAFTMVQNKNSSSSAVSLTYAEIRVYASHSLVFTPATGTTINSIIAIAGSEAYANALGGSSTSNCSKSVSNSTVTITPTDGTSAITLTNSAQSRLNSITVNYTSGSGTTYSAYSTTCSAPSSPSLTATPNTLSGLNYSYGNGPSAASSFSISGSNLTNGNLTIAAPTHFEVSTSENSGYASSITVAANGTLNSTTIYVRQKAGNAVGNYNNETIAITGCGLAAAVNVTVSGSVYYEDVYIDNIWSIVTPNKTGTYTRPTLSDQDPGGLTDCQHLHYHFVGWITKTKYDLGTAIDARTTPTGDLVAGGSVTANGTTYYAVWEQEGSGGGTNVYTLVEETLSDWSGNYIFTNPDYDHAMSNSVSSGKFGSKTVSPSSKQITSTDGDIIWVVTKGTGDNASKYSVYNASANKYANNGTSSTSASLSNDAVFLTFTRDETYGDVAIKGAGGRWFSYYSGNSDFRTYNQSSDYGVYLYRNSVSYEDPKASCGEEYTITINKNNASATCTSCGAKVNANATTLSNLVAPTWTGHEVDYYMIASADNSTKIAEADGTLAKGVASWTDGDGKWIKGTDATIYAKWKYAEYEIAYYDQGGSAFSGVHGEDYPTTHTYNTATTLVNPTKNGYNFAGWYTSSDCSTGLVTTLGATAYTSGPINLYAKWTLKTYTVTWVVNGSTVATQTSVTYGTAYEDLSSTPSDPADNALSSCGSDRFVGWVTAEYTSEGGTKVSQYDPYAVTNSTVIDDTHHTFYAMFAKESGTAFSLSVTSGDFKISGLVDGVNYYATGALDNGKYAVTTTAGSGDDFTFTKVSDGVYTIKHKRSNKFVTWSGSTNFGEADASINWTITAADHGSWSVIPATATTRAFVMNYSSSNPENSVFKPYATSNVTNTPAQYYYIEIGTSNLINYRTGCCSEKITLTVSDATSGAGGTVAMKWNNASKSSGDQVSTCSEGTLAVEVTANPSYTLTAIAIAGTNKTITIVPSDLTTGLPSTSKMTYTVTVPSLATGTLTITPTFTRTYSVTYNLDGGETAGNTDVANYQSGATVTLVTPSPEKSGYNFAGWDIRDASSNVVTETSGHFTMPASNVTVTATWTAKPLTSISVTPATATIYVGQYVELPVTYDPADILTKGYTLVSTPSWCVTTGSTNTTLKITGGRGGATITEDKVETVSIKASADNTKRASVTVTVKPLPVDHFVDLIHGEVFDDHAATIVDNNLSTAYSAPGHADVDAPLVGNDCEKQNLHLVGWIESEWANTHLTATMSEFIAAEDDEHNPLFFATYAPMNVSGKTYYAVWAKEKE